MIRIVFLVDTLCIGGRENSIIDICNNLDIQKFSIFIVTLTNDMNELEYKLNKNISLIPLNIEHKELVGYNSFFSFFGSIRKLYTKLNDIKPDIIHTHSYLHRLLIENIAIRNLSKKPYCFHTIHTSGMYYNSNRLVDKFKFLIEKFAIGLVKPKLIGISEVIQNNNIKLLKNSSQGSIYIPNGVDTFVFDKNKYMLKKNDFGLNEDDIVITYVARFCKGKNHITLLKSLIKVINKYPKVKLLLAGSGDEFEIIDKFLIFHKLINNVILLGAIDNVPEILSITDFCVFPSEFEGFSLTLIEKMSMGLPVIAADNESFKSIIIHNKNGMLFPMFDSDILADCIIELIENNILFNEISINSLETSLNYSLDKVMIKYNEIYSSCIN